MPSLSTPVKVVGILTTVLLLIVVNPWFTIPEEQAQLGDWITYAFWISFIVLLVLLFMERDKPGGETMEVEGPAFTRFLFSNTKAGLFWLPVRLFLGFSWLDAGWHKFTDPEGVWVGANAGTAILGYWERAVAVPEEGRPAITYEWYRNFLQLLIDNGAESWMTYVITFGEIAVGIGLIFGILTGFAAFFGALMNMSFLLAGSASTNPVLFTLAVGLMLAWKVAGYYGVDRWLLPLLGTPWHPAVVAGRDTGPAETTSG
jgi:thiosulfate dehydrogenase [quinone] large subunit